MANLGSTLKEKSKHPKRVKEQLCESVRERERERLEETEVFLGLLSIGPPIVGNPNPTKKIYCEPK